MVEDKILIWRFKRGSREALQRIYEKYVVYLVTLATALSNDVSTAEDIVHDVFVSFAHYLLQGAEHDPIDDEQENQKREQLDEQCFIDTDQCNVADNFHWKNSVFIACGVIRRQTTAAGR